MNRDKGPQLASSATLILLLLPVMTWLGHACDAPPRFLLRVAEPPSNVCLNRLGSNILSATFTYTYNTLEGQPIYIAELDGEPGCTITPGDRAMDGNVITGNITVNCTESGVQLTTGPHTIVLKASYEGIFPCSGGVAFGSATVTVDPRAEITLRAANLELCPGTTSFTVQFTNSDTTFTGPLQAAAILNGNIPCTAESGPPGATGRGGPITVTCSAGNNEPFPEGQHTLAVQASAADATLTGCASPTPAEISTVVTVLSAPSVRLIRPSTLQPACSNSNRIRIRFPYRLASAGTQPVLSNAQALPVIVGQGGAGVPRPSCKTQVQEIDSSSGRLEVTCTGNFTALRAASFDVTASVTASCGMRPVTGRRRLTPPENAAFTHSSEIEAIDDASAPAGVTPLEAPSTPADAGAVVVASTLSESSVTTPAVATARARASQPLACCFTNAAAYGMQTTPRRSLCFKHERPGTLAGRMNEGFYLQGEVANGVMQMVPQNMRRQTDAADCRGGVTVGEVSSRCMSRSMMQLTVKTRRIDIIEQQMFYFSCNRLGENTVGDNWVSPGPPTGEDGEFRFTFFNLETPQGCNCRETFWAVYEFGTFRGLPLEKCR